jgi:SWI/SNF-related matrix-associated actin-dependent regulator 1 of chromatin subfamily A
MTKITGRQVPASFKDSQGLTVSYTAVGLKVEPYHEPTVKFLKLLKSSYDPRRLEWVMPYKGLRPLYKFAQLQNIPFELDFEPKTLPPKKLELNYPQHIVDSIIAALHACGAHFGPSQVQPIGVTLKCLKRPLFPFQESGLAWAYKTNFRCLIGDEMGLGKTIQAIACIAATQASRVLVICPASVCYVWNTEIKNTIDIQDNDIVTVRGVSAKVPKVRVIVTSYASARANMANLLEHGIDMVIVDEAHNLKNEATKQAKSIIPVILSSRYAIALTGTPALNKLADMHAVCYALQPHHFFGKRSLKTTHPKIIMDTIKANIMIRRLKKDVLKDLPEKTRTHFVVTKVDLDLSSFNAIFDNIDSEIAGYDTKYDQERERLWEKHKGKEYLVERDLEKFYNRFQKSIEGNVFEAFKAAGDSKAEFVARHVSEIINNSDLQVIVFYHHKSVGDIIEKNIPNCLRMDGNTQNSLRGVNVEEFQQGKHRVVLLSLKAFSDGITLTAASKIVFSELWWTPSTLLQGEGRAHRYGQRNPVNCEYILAQGTFDEAMYQLIKNKWNIINSILDNNKNEAIGANTVVKGSVMRELIQQMIKNRISTK